MEPITTTIVTALAMGAAAGLQPVAEQAIKDAYAGLKALIQRRYGQVHLEPLEATPESEIQRMAVGEVLEQAGAQQDDELLQKAREVIEVVQAKAPEIASNLNIDLGVIDVAADIELGDLQADGDVDVAIDEAKSSSGGFRLTGVRAGRAKDDDPKDADPKE